MTALLWLALCVALAQDAPAPPSPTPVEEPAAAPEPAPGTTPAPAPSPAPAPGAAPAPSPAPAPGAAPAPPASTPQPSNAPTPPPAPAPPPPPQRLRWDPPPAVGVQTTVTLHDEEGRPEPGATVQVVYRPGLDGERQRAIGITDSLGRVRWTPEVGGVAEVHAGKERRRVAVAWPSPPMPSLVLLVLVGLSGLGFAGYGWRAHSARRRRPT